MAVNISFVGFVNEVKVFGWGVVARVSHNQQKKTESGTWETVGRDYFDVTLPDGVTAVENQRVSVVGTFKSREFTRKDGSKGLGLEVRATEFLPVSSGPSSAAPQAKFTPDMTPAGREQMKSAADSWALPTVDPNDVPF